LASERGVEFAMKCKEVAERIDLGEVSPTWIGRFRFRLHLSFCQACRNYSDASKALKRAVRELVLGSEKPLHLDRLNKELMEKHARKDDA
jgi:hypothetical protein